MKHDTDQFILGGVPVLVEHRTPALRARLAHLYAHAIVARSEPPGHVGLAEHASYLSQRPLEFSIEALPGEDAPPPARSPTIHLLADRHIWGALEGDQLELGDGRTQVRVDYVRGRANLTLYRGALASTSKGAAEDWDYAARFVATHRFFPLALNELLRTRQRFSIHAAAVAGPGHGVLVVGDSEAGKSTLSYRALRCGYRCVADDGVLLGADAEGGFVAYPFYREFSLDPAIVEPADLPRATSIEPTAKGKRARLPLDSARLAQSCRVTDVLLIERGTGWRSLRSPCGKGDALAELVRQNKFVMVNPALAGAHLAALAELLRTVRTSTLVTGRDVIESDTAVEALLSPGSRC